MSVKGKIIPKVAECWEGSHSGHLMGSPGERSLLFPTPHPHHPSFTERSRLICKTWCTRGQPLCRRRWPQAHYKALTHPGPNWVFILWLPRPMLLPRPLSKQNWALIANRPTIQSPVPCWVLHIYMLPAKSAVMWKLKP